MNLKLKVYIPRKKREKMMVSDDLSKWLEENLHSLELISGINKRK